MEEKDLKFFLGNQSKINQLASFKGQVREHIATQVEQAGNSIEGVVLQRGRSNDKQNKRLRYYTSPKHSELMITVLFEDILKNGNLKLIVELRGGLLKNRSKYKSVKFFKEENQAFEPEILSNNFYKEDKNPWAHFAYKAYKLTSEQPANLASFIQERLANDGFMTVFKALEKEVESVK